MKLKTIFIFLFLLACTSANNLEEPTQFSGFLIEVNFKTTSEGELKLKSNDKIYMFHAKNLDLDFLTINHLNQHMLLGDPINISAIKKNNNWEILKIYDLDGTVHVE
tara:strand:- start:228 stop:548 length:321 start_codon:yes stop_codon:yes gene_type:complete